jgi:hypothetical protein
MVGYRDTAAGRFGAFAGTADDGKTSWWLSQGRPSENRVGGLEGPAGLGG